MMSGKIGSNLQILGLQIIKFLHSSPAKEDIILLMSIIVLIFMINLAKCISSSYVAVILAYLCINLVL